jgi:metal-dependent hydrolase (beta-lactamase superfamily II)
MRNWRKSGRFRVPGDRFVIGDGLELFSGGRAGQAAVPRRQLFWYMRKDGELVPDDFSTSKNPDRGGKTERCWLVAGCAHSGIVNILERCHVLKGRYR